MPLVIDTVASLAGTLFNETKLPVALYVAKPLQVIYANTALYTCLGVTSEEAKETSEQLLENTRDKWPISAISQALECGSEFSCAEQSPNGTALITHQFWPARTESGENFLIHIILTDETKGTGDEVTGRAKLWQNFSDVMANTAGAGTFFVDLVTGDFKCSAGFSRLLTCSESAELNRQTLHHYIHPDDRLPQERLESLFTRGLPVYNFRSIWSNGSVHRLKTSLGAFNGASGAPEYLFGVVVDITEEEHQKDQERNLMQLSENSMDFMGIADLDQRMRYLNSAGKELIGLAKDEDGNTVRISDFFDPEYQAIFQDEIWPALNTDGNWSGRFDICQLKTGEKIACMANFMAIRSSSGNVSNIGLTIRDLRPELLKQKELEIRELQFRSFVEQAPVAICIFEGKDMVVEIANQAMLELLGKKESVIGKTFQQGFPELEEKVCPKVVRDVLEKGERHYQTESKAEVVRNGRMEAVYFNFSIAPMQEPSGNASRVMLVMIEVTEQIKAKSDLERSEKRFRSIVTEAPVAKALYVGENMLIDLANEAMIKIWGKDESVIGKTLQEALPELENQPFLGLLREVYTTGIAYHTDQQAADLVVNGKLQRFWFNFTYKPLHDADGNIYAILNTAVDITEHVRQQQQKDDFIGIASHELKTPVTSIKAYTQVLENLLRRTGDDDKADIVLKMDRQINRLTRLIGDLLDTTKIDTGKIQFNRRNFVFEEMLHEVIEETQRISDQHQIVLKTEPIGNIYADRERIGQVVINFITNAIKYSPEADKVIIHAKVVEDGVELGVEDFGIGISTANLTKVFEQFYRVSGNKEHTFPGLGLGLYISAQIIDREGGRIWVESEEGKGSVFKFFLPFKTRKRN